MAISEISHERLRHLPFSTGSAAPHDPLPWNSVATWLELLANYRGEDMLRVKGILNVEESDKPIVLHGVQHLFHPPVQLDAWPSEDRRSRVVFITRDMDEDTVQGMLDALSDARNVKVV